MKDKVVFTFGRFNPPTTGHEKLIEKVAAVAKKEGADFMVFPSHSQNAKKDPLDFRTKVGFMKKMFPKYSKNIISNNNAKTAINVATLLYEMGYKECAMVVGGDRVTEFKTLLNKYNGVEGRHGLYDFKGGVEIHSAGERDPDAEGVTGMSASKMRAAAAANDYESFSKGLPPKFEKTNGKKLFDAIKSAMGIREELSQFLTQESFREFISDPIVELIEDLDDYELFEFLMERKTAQDKDVEDRDGTQPKKYYAKDAEGKEMSKATKKRRDAHFKKHADKPDGDKSSYKPAPGDANAKTKPSKHTLKYKKMFGEKVTPKQIDDLEKFADRMLAKFDIDVTFTRHFVDRMNDPRNNPEIKVAELQKFFKKIQKKKGSQIKANPDIEAVLKDMSTNLNLPVVINYRDGEFEVVHKTIMRKKNFSTTSKELKYEEVIVEYKLPRKDFEKLKKGDEVTVHFDSSIKKGHKETLVVKGKSRSAKYNVDKVSLGSATDSRNRTKFTLYSRKGGDATLAWGDMGVSMTKFVKEAVSPAQQAAIAIAKKESGKYDKDGKKKEEDCWPGFKQVGMKKKNGKNVPNCVPEDFKMNPDREKELEKIAQDLPDADFKKRYGDEWKSVKMATAMNILKKKLGYQTESISGAENQPFVSKAGAGEWGSKKLRDTYMRDTPFQEKLMTPRQSAYIQALDQLDKLIASKGKRHSLKYYVATIAKSYSGIDPKELEKMYRER